MISKIISKSKTDARYLSLMYGEEWWNNSTILHDADNSPSIKTIVESALITTPNAYTLARTLHPDTTIFKIDEVETISLAKSFDEMVMKQLAKEDN